MRSRFQFVDDHRDAFEVKRLCQVLEVNRSSYYKWRAGREARAARRRDDQRLAAKIREINAESGGAYGSPRVTAELQDGSMNVNEKRVARVMRTYAITGIRLRRRVRTTVPDPAPSPVPDLFERDFTAAEPGRKYMGDITYLPLADGRFLYLATVLDCFSRKVVGWSIADYMRTDLVADALLMAARTRGGLEGSVFHSDHGAQYGSRAFAGLCDQLKVTRSMGAVGSSADNAACESFHASLKRETLQGARDYGDPATCRNRVLVDEFEGCLSVPGATLTVPRTDRAVARGVDKDGNPLVIEGLGYFARCLQHETDHLMGHTYLDRLSKRDRKDALRQMEDRREEVFAQRAIKAARLGR